MTLPSETLLRWREAVDAVPQVDDPLYEGNGSPTRLHAVLHDVSRELREAWLAALIAEEEAIDAELRAAYRRMITLAIRALPETQFDPDKPTRPTRGDRGGEG